MNWKFCLAILTCNVVFMSASYTMLIPFLPVYLTHELGVDPSSVNIWSGIVFSSTFAVSAIMAPIWGRMADRRGKRLMAIRASFLLAISYFFGGIVTTPLELTFMRMFQGFAAGLWPMELAIMTTYAPPKKMGICLGIMQGGLTAGGVIGPLFGGILAEVFGMRMSFFLAAAALFLNFLVLLFFVKEPPDSLAAEPTPGHPETSGSGLWRNPLIRDMLLFGVFVQMVILIVQPVLTTYITELAGNLDNVIFVAGLVFSLSGFASAISAPLWGRFGQHQGFHKSLTYALTLAGIFSIIQSLPRDLYLFAASQFCVGLFFSGIYPSINAILAQNTDSHTKGRVFGLLFSAQQIGSMAGPLLGGMIATFCGMHYVFIAAGLILLSISIIVRRHTGRITTPHPGTT
ncbi:MFS transporter [Megasphaera vaginalis (ex Srinivasan et al. 2021)]|uniref:Transporter, major facilitator domain protein n=1 Tax=Megasphaera vaginalis (ex Srinivasan et al. 2021) TaxID=1111454 RepID=U7UAT6_9FIRM|nr:MFS transporter [Megasphaera vaginalis (ex Srinivasan et al. 2021)]ERT56455.1 transporter, major facilitator domain protein [Megasphaera vaginalis (ex Srinivasan et al. 2021)]